MSFRPGGGTPDEQITRAALQRGYDPAALISYARQETGNYSSGLYERANNLFSLKGTGPAGSVQMKDDEPGLSTFRAYNSIEEAINDFMDVIERQYPDVAALKGSPDKMFSALQGKGWATDPNWAANVLKGRSTVSVPNVGAGLGDIKISQAQWGASVGMTPQEAAAACGPYAAALFAQATGRMPNPAEAERLARAAGWTEAGMGGTGNFMKLLGSMGVNAVRTNTAGMSAADITAMASNAGSMTGFSTPGHYFASTGFDPASGKFNVGATGTFAGGSTWMTVSEMTALMGPIQDIITLGGQMGAAFTTGGKQVTDGVGIIPPAIATAGAAVTTFGETTATTAAGVVANTNLMASGALTSVTAMETGILTTVQTTAGTTIATVTDMQGQVTSQYATLANGATLTMGDMAAGVMTSTTDLGTGVMTTVQDMSGNYITTITDLSGNVTAQYTQLAADAVAQTAVQSTGVQAETATMAENVLTSVTDMGDGVITTVTDTNGQTTATVRDMSGKVTSQYSTMSTQSSGAVTRLAQTSVEQFGNIAEGARKPIEPINGLDKAMGSIKPPNLSSVVREFDKVTDAAKRAASAMDKVADKGGNKSAKEFAKKAAGGPVSGMTPYLVGEQGPELFMPATNGTIIPNNRLGGGGAVVYQVTVNVNGALLANNRMIEEAVVQGLDSARRRGREA
jgi:hypothetical protein